jgi:hypothetical protein
MLELINQHVFEMFDAQNSLVDLDDTRGMEPLLSSDDPQTVEDLRTYALRIEAFLEFVRHNPVELKVALAGLKRETSPA